MSIDIVDQIDALIDEQLSEGEPIGGFDYDDPDYPECWHCGRDWHGLAITARIERMRWYGMYDEGYSYADDDSEVLCPGSTFIGPMPQPHGYDDGAPLFQGQSLHGVIWDEAWNPVGTGLFQFIESTFAESMQRWASWMFEQHGFSVRVGGPERRQERLLTPELDRSELELAGKSDALNSDPEPVIQDLGESIRRFGGSVRRANSTVPMWAHDPTRTRRTRNRR